MPLVALTGGIASGKSTIARRLAGHGAVVVDADQLVREVQTPGSPVLAAIAAAFGDGMLRADGSLDRAALGGRVFGDDDEKKSKESKEPTSEQQREKQLERDIERKMNKTALVTLWVDPKIHQIVKYTFDNVNFDFLPAAWLVRVNDLKASMTMSQPLKDVKDLWLPQSIDWYFSAMLAIGQFDARYHLEYHDYRQATTSGRIKGGGRP